jgi:signal transduction histidine kinase
LQPIGITKIFQKFCTGGISEGAPAVLTPATKEGKTVRGMGFVDDLRSHLERVARGEPEEAPVTPSLRDADVRAMFLDAMRRRVEGADDKVPVIRGTRLSLWHSRFSDASALSSLAAHLEHELRAGLAPTGDVQVLRPLARQVVDELHELPPAGDLVSQLEVRRIARALDAVSLDVAPVGDARYFATENRLTRSTHGRVVLTRLGRVFLDLPRHEATAWLLCLSSLQANDDDGAHISLDVLRDVHQRPDIRHAHVEWEQIGPDDSAPTVAIWPDLTDAFAWLRALQVVWEWSDEFEWGYSLHAAFRPVLGDLVGERRSPLLLLAESLLAEERGALAGHAPQPDFHERPSDVQARYASMVVHEIRNVVVPMRSALSAMGRTLEPTEGAAWQPHRERIEKGIERLFRFTSELEQVVRVGSSPPEPQDLTTVIRDAVAGLNGGLGAHLTLSLPTALPHVHGHRARLVLVFVNLLRNAAQSRVGDPVQIAVAVSLDEGRSVVTTHVDDDGPGVPEAHREVIFARGVSLRPGGSGQGLALVREVIEVEMRGSVRCEASPHGGARFTLSIPLGRTEHT